MRGRAGRARRSTARSPARRRAGPPGVPRRPPRRDSPRAYPFLTGRQKRSVPGGRPGQSGAGRRSSHSVPSGRRCAARPCRRRVRCGPRSTRGRRAGPSGTAAGSNPSPRSLTHTTTSPSAPAPRRTPGSGRRRAGRRCGPPRPWRRAAAARGRRRGRRRPCPRTARRRRPRWWRSPRARPATRSSRRSGVRRNPRSWFWARMACRRAVGEVVGAPHRGQVLQHRVVQTGGALGPLGGAGRGGLGLEQGGLQAVARRQRALQQLDQPGQRQRPEGEDQQGADAAPDVPAGGDAAAGDGDHAQPGHGADHVPPSPRQGDAGQDDERRPAHQRPAPGPCQRPEQLHGRGGQQPPPPPGDGWLDELRRQRPHPQQHDAAPQHRRVDGATTVGYRPGEQRRPQRGDEPEAAEEPQRVVAEAFDRARGRGGVGGHGGSVAPRRGVGHHRTRPDRSSIMPRRPAAGGRPGPCRWRWPRRPSSGRCRPRRRPSSSRGTPR